MEVDRPVHECLPVAHDTDAAACRRVAAEVAARAGLADDDLGRLAIVVTELATNLVRHTPHGGSVLLGAYGPAVEVLSLDTGPGMADVDQCFRDGHSTAGGAGTGLGAVRRLSSSFDVYSRPGLGTLCVATVGPRGASDPAGHRFVEGGISVPMPGETANGDRWSCQHRVDGVAVMVVDGLGHGAFAEAAAHTACEVFGAHAHRSASTALDVVHHALRPTRGAAVAVAIIDSAAGTLEYAGIGNIAGAIVSDAGAKQLISMNGIAGHGTPRMKSFPYAWTNSSTLVMHTDGVSPRWDLAAYPGILARRPIVAAAALYRDFSRQRDDATVVLAQERAS